ncbi:F-box only protein 38 [Cichlidogyrus casuarinus]|uniref:F-box only protein 38 n=1 Tax=Cichlidogyrus casuarinus TaxID=1844966 RepID=A0ABD2QJK7_9PLAT
MLAKNEDAVCQATTYTESSSAQRRPRNSEESRNLRNKRIRSSSSSTEGLEDTPTSTGRRSRRLTGSHPLSSQIKMEVYSEESKDAHEQIGIGPFETIDEISLASSVFVDPQLFPSCESPNSKNVLLNKSSSQEPSSKSTSDPVTCNTAGLIIDQVDDEKIDTPNTQVDQEDVGSTEGEDADECVEEDPCQVNACEEAGTSSHHVCGGLAIDTDEHSSQALISSIASSSSSQSTHLLDMVEPPQKQLLPPSRRKKAKSALLRRKTIPHQFHAPKRVACLPHMAKHGSEPRLSTPLQSDTDASAAEEYSSSSIDSGNLTLQSDTGSTNSLASVSGKRVYPLRSRLKKESMLKEYRAKQVSPKSFIELPTEVLLRIMHYLSIQDLFRIQVVCRRMRTVVDRYLLLVKRINFSSGLPFAYLPASLGDNALKRILSRTPEVTHILGFYPKVIHNNLSPSNSNDALTYSGIIESFSKCTKLRSVELMDVQLMSQLVNFLPRVKFHGMFRNRPDSWDSEYAVPLPQEASSEPAPPAPGGPSFFSWWLSTLYGMVRTVSHLDDHSDDKESKPSGASLAVALRHAAAHKSSRLSLRFEPQPDAPIGHGSPFASLVAPGAGPQAPPVVINNVHILQVVAGGIQDALPIDLLPNLMARAGNRLINAAPQGAAALAPLPIVPQARRQAVLMLAIAAALNWVLPQQAQAPDAWAQQLLAAAAGEQIPPFLRRLMAHLLLQLDHARDATTSTSSSSSGSNSSSQEQQQQSQIITPIPSVRDRWINLPNSIANLTKLDLVSVAINIIPRLDNIKYLHLKWVRFIHGIWHSL